MRKYLVECNLEFQSSHMISTVGFDGGNIYNLDEGIKCSCPLGLPNTTIELLSSGEPTFTLKIETFDLVDQSSQLSYVNKLANYLSFVVAKNEYNGHYGTPFIKIKLSSFNVTPIEVENDFIKNNLIELKSLINLKSSLSIQSISSVRFNNINILRVHYNELLDYYYSGLKAESEKSKFFHWFLIIEYLEGSERYSRDFPKGTMFTEDESNNIKTLAKSLSTDKKNVLLSVLTRTSAFRNSKLLSFLNCLGIDTLTSMKGETSVTLDTVKTITSARNKLFHTGSEFPSDTLWFLLFPLVTEVISAVINDPNCLK